MLNNSIGIDSDPRVHYLYFCSGLFVGLCNYFSSVTTGIICGIISMIDARDPTLFYKLVILEIIPASIGLVGFIIGIVLNSKSYLFQEIEPI